MSAFTAFSAPLLIQYDQAASQALGADHWRVAQAFKYFIGSEDSQQWVTVPAGYLTDGASVPRVFWSLLPPWGTYGQAAVVHDLLCEYLSIVDHGQVQAITRERADQIFNEAMRVLGVPQATRLSISEGVKFYRLVGGVNSPSTTLKKRQLEAAWS
jgi:hypothetical protein